MTQQSQSGIEWLLVAACALTAVSAAVESQPWPAAGFMAIGAAVLVRALRLPDRGRAWTGLVYILLTFSIALYVLRLILRLGSA